MPRAAAALTSAPRDFVTIDASTQSLAFAVVKNGKIVRYGKITYEGSNLDERIKEIYDRLK